MILDALNRFANNANAFGDAAANVLAAGVIDLGPRRRDVGSGEPIFTAVQVTQAFTGGNTVTFEVVTSDDPTFADATTEVVGEATIPVASLTADRTFGFYLRPSLAPNGRRYLGFRNRTVGAASTTGRITAALVYNPGDAFLRNYPAVQPFV